MKRYFIFLIILFACSCSKDKSQPIIEILGKNPDTVIVNTQTVYADAGAKATDAEDGEVEVVISGTVNMAVPGAYALSYSAQDNSNNFSANATRTVYIIKADGNYASTESCSSSGSSNYDVSVSSNASLDTIILSDFPVSGYFTKAVVKNGGFAIYQQTVSPVMSLHGNIAAEGSALTVTYTRTSLQGPGTTESCSAQLKKK